MSKQQDPPVVYGQPVIPVAMAVPHNDPLPPGHNLRPPLHEEQQGYPPLPPNGLGFRPDPNPFVDTHSAREYLTGNAWPVGLQDALIRNLKKIPFRFFICDDSGSMATNDGKKLIGNKTISCTRWDELTDTLSFHVGLAKACRAPTQFRLLNGLPPVVVGMDEAMDPTNCEALRGVFRESPGGYTPLCRHLNEVIAEIRAMEPFLRANGQKVMVIIATDGEASDGNVANAMLPLKNLPCSVVIRLCTDQDDIVNYWNEVDNNLEINLDVIDDLSGEAEEIKTVNPWLCYGQAVQRFREFGNTMKEFDFIDESPLSHEYARNLISNLLNISDLPHPQVDYATFESMIKNALQRTNKTIDPITGRSAPWIDMGELRRAYGPSKGCTIM